MGISLALHAESLASLYARGQNIRLQRTATPGATPKNVGRLKAVQCGVAPGVTMVLAACTLVLLFLHILLVLFGLLCLYPESGLESRTESRWRAGRYLRLLFVTVAGAQIGLE